MTNNGMSSGSSENFRDEARDVTRGYEVRPSSGGWNEVFRNMNAQQRNAYNQFLSDESAMVREGSPDARQEFETVLVNKGPREFFNDIKSFPNGFIVFTYLNGDMAVMDREGFTETIPRFSRQSENERFVEYIGSMSHSVSAVDVLNGFVSSFGNRIGETAMMNINRHQTDTLRREGPFFVDKREFERHNRQYEPLFTEKQKKFLEREAVSFVGILFIPERSLIVLAQEEGRVGSFMRFRVINENGEIINNRVFNRTDVNQRDLRFMQWSEAELAFLNGLTGQSSDHPINNRRFIDVDITSALIDGPGENNK